LENLIIGLAIAGSRTNSDIKTKYIQSWEGPTTSILIPLVLTIKFFESNILLQDVFGSITFHL
ncbi:hypothetical protein ACJX0J_027820, partial [Zea mays]